MKSPYFNNKKRTNIINNTKKISKNKEATGVFEDSLRREFFKYENGSLVEYDYTKANGEQVVLANEEKETIKTFDNFKFH